MGNDNEQQFDHSEPRWFVLWHGAAADAPLELSHGDDPRNGNDAAFEDEVTAERPVLTWLERWRLRREIKSEQRAERKRDRDAARAVKRAARKTIKEWDQQAKWRAKAESDGIEQCLKHPALNFAGKTLAECAQMDTLQGRRLAATTIIEAFTAMRDRRYRYIATIGTWLTALAIALLVTCSACAGKQQSIKVVPAAPDIATDERAVFVVLACVNSNTGEAEPRMFGSGVLVDADVVLTAEHVVKLPDDKPCKPDEFVVVAVARKDSVLLAVDAALLVGRDIAMLKLSEPIPGVTTLKAGHSPKVGDNVCISSMHPNYERRCGPVTAVHDGLDKGEAHLGIAAVGGNSGSGVYNEQGELVGILVQRIGCALTEPLKQTSCGSAASMLDKVVLQ